MLDSNTRNRILVGLLTVSAAGVTAWNTSESFVPEPMIPTKGDVPTIGYGSTHYEDGTPVKLTDPPITRKRADDLAKNLRSKDEEAFRATLPGVKLYQAEYDLYIDFVGQYGIANWRKSSMRANLIAGNYRGACESLLQWRFQAGRDCKLPENWGPQGCKGVWTRQQARYEKCIAAQGGV